MTPPARMRAVAIARPGGPEVLTLVDRPTPAPGPGQILIRLTHAGVNRPDCLQRAGVYDPPPDASDLPGLEGTGYVAATGPGVTRWGEGDALCALLPGGGYAEYAVTRADHALPVPPGLSMARAAALPETHFTVWHNMLERGRLAAGERFLVHGGSSGIGTTAIQIAARRGAHVFATAGGDEKCAACTRLGAERAINYRREDFAEVLRAADGADLILDMVGGDYLPRNLSALAEDGRLVQIAVLGGPTAEVNIARIMARRLTVTGSTLRPQPDAAKARIAAALEREIWPDLAAGRIAPVMDRAFPLGQAASAHERMESSAHIGKMVLEIAG